MAVVYSIRNWNDTFEVAQSRKVSGAHTWVAMPTKHDGKIFRKIMARTDGLVIFAAWVLIVEVAAKCPTHGQLSDADGPLTAADLNLKTGCPTDAFETALNVLSSKDFGWMDVDEWEDAGSTLPTQDSTGQDIESASADSSAELGLNGHASTADEFTEFVFPTTGKGSKEWPLTKTKLAEYIASYPGLDVTNEFRKARQWCRDKPRQRKTAHGMPAFLTNWLSRSQNRGAGGKAPIEEGYRTVTREEFSTYVRNLKFNKDGPQRNSDDQNWVYGTLRDGTKVECKEFKKP